MHHVLLLRSVLRSRFLLCIRSKPHLVTDKDIKGDLHLHTKATDGANTIEEMARAAIKKGYEYIAITNHTKAVRIAGGLNEKETVRRLFNFMEYCKVGRITTDDTIKILENSERFGMKTQEPSCYFTTGFLNGFLYTTQNKHVKETKCIAVGDPYCEWEFT